MLKFCHYYIYSYLKEKSVVNFSFFEINITMKGLSVAQYHVTEFGSTCLSQDWNRATLYHQYYLI